MKLNKFMPISLLALALAGLTGCGSKGTKEGELLIWTFSDEMKEIVTDYYSKHYEGVVNVDVKSSVTQVTYDLSNAQRARKGIPDIVCLEAAVIAKYTDKNINDSVFLSLDDIEGTSNMYDYTKSVATSLDGHLIGLSWQATPGAFFYKEDVAAQVGITSVEQMEEKISTWQGFLDLAADCKTHNIHVTSAITEPIKVFLGSRSKGWVENNTLQMEDVMFGPTTGTKANCFDVMRELQQNQYTNGTVERASGWNNDIASTSCLGNFCSSWGLKFDLMKYAGTTAGHWKMCKAPENYFKGGTWLAVPRGATNIDLAKQFIKYVTTDQDFLTERCQKTGDFMNSRAVMQTLKQNYQCEFLGGQNHLEKLYTIAEQINGNLISPYDAIIDSSFQSVAGYYAQLANGTPAENEEEREKQKDNFVVGVKGSYPQIIVE